MLVLVTRPREQAAATARALEELGHQVLIDPVLEIRPLPRPALPADMPAAVALTSANAVPALAWVGPAVPVFAVGAATAAAARAAGRERVDVAAGDGHALAGLILARIAPDAGTVLHLAGTEVREGLESALTAAGFRYRRVTVYEAVPAERPSPQVEVAIRTRRLGAVLFYSPRSAALWAEQVRRLGLVDKLTETLAVCLSEAIAGPLAGLPFRACRVAPARDQKALLRCLDGT
jgi:uroporphyrinogen-III synthase